MGAWAASRDELTDEVGWQSNGGGGGLAARPHPSAGSDPGACPRHSSTAHQPLSAPA